MTAVGLDRLQGQYPLDIIGADDIEGVGETRATRGVLLPEEGEASLPLLELDHDPLLVLAGRTMGKELTSDNLAWRGDPVPVMRKLQELLVADALSRAEDQRGPSLHAIQTVELAVRWRLRWAQMRRSEAESHFIDPQGEKHATQHKE